MFFLKAASVAIVSFYAPIRRSLGLLVDGGGFTMRRTRVLAGLAATVLAASTAWAAAPAAEAAPVAPVAFTSNNLATWQTDGIVWALAQSGGKVFAGGNFTAVRPPGAAAGSSEQPAVNFAEFDAATGAPTGCSVSFTISTGTATVRALTVSPDGRTLYAGGYFDHVDGVHVNSLAAVDIATCTPDAGFHPQVNATVRTITATPDAVYFGGDFTLVNSQPRKRLAMVGASGALSGWAPAADLPVRATLLSPDGTDLVVGGDFDTLNGADSHALGVLDTATGADVRTYPLGFIESNSVVKALAGDATGFYTGNEGTGGGVFDGRIALNWSDFNQRWRDTCLGATQAVVSYQGVLYAGSHTHDCSSMGEQPDGRRQHLIAEPTTTGTELPWSPDTNDGIGEQIGPRAITVATTDTQPYLWVSGEFTTVNGTPQQSLTRFGTGPDGSAPSTPVLNVAGLTAGALDVRIRTGWDTDDGTLTYRLYRDGGTTPVWTGTASSVWWSRPQIAYTDTGLAPGSTHSYKVTVDDGTNTVSSGTVGATVPSDTGAYDSQVLADGADLYWRYDSSGTYVADSSPDGQTGYFNGGGTYKDGTGPVGDDPATPMGFDGSTGWVYDEVPQAPAAGYTVQTWFRTTTTKGGQLAGFGDKQVLLSSVTDRMLYMTNAGRIVFGAYHNGYQTLTTLSAYNNGAWHQAVATQDGHGMRLYLDGRLVADNGSTPDLTHLPRGYWHTGGDGGLTSWPGHPASNYFQGDLDETAIYPAALSSAQISRLYGLRTS
jgi:Concanavalin A-like lectin/glucanases superfamily